MRLFAPAFSTAVRASMPISAVRAMMGRSNINTSRMYLGDGWAEGMGWVRGRLKVNERHEERVHEVYLRQSRDEGTTCTAIQKL
jgi:hypothetical protein